MQDPTGIAELPGSECPGTAVLSILAKPRQLELWLSLDNSHLLRSQPRRLCMKEELKTVGGPSESLRWGVTGSSPKGLPQPPSYPGTGNCTLLAPAQPLSQRQGWKSGSSYIKVPLHPGSHRPPSSLICVPGPEVP